MPTPSQHRTNSLNTPSSGSKTSKTGSAGEVLKAPVRPGPQDNFDSIIDKSISKATSPAPSTAPTRQSSEKPVQQEEESSMRRKPDKVRAKWEQATFGKSARSVTIEEHVKNLTSPIQEVRRASAEILQYSSAEVLRPLSKLLQQVAANDPDPWTASYAYRAYLRQLKERELKIHPAGQPVS